MSSLRSSPSFPVDSPNSCRNTPRCCCFAVSSPCDWSSFLRISFTDAKLSGSLGRVLSVASAPCKAVFSASQRPASVSRSLNWASQFLIASACFSPCASPSASCLVILAISSSIVVRARVAGSLSIARTSVSQCSNVLPCSSPSYTSVRDAAAAVASPCLSASSRAAFGDAALHASRWLVSAARSSAIERNRASTSSSPLSTVSVTPAAHTRTRAVALPEDGPGPTTIVSAGSAPRSTTTAADSCDSIRHNSDLPASLFSAVVMASSSRSISRRPSSPGCG